ncbi:30S ribosomal protein S6 [Modestobacter sp. VKM Ac-2977]|uniref:30S ribosomal protein S6 n=1 Tax=Modestobacter sp. VKM Ac-2977 TaxID=3004131 RepID=UPI0022AABE60|nr:30S ribosomal protein S6 [Modestobacter sp. VKM Ac-2977]MCZ2820777.1 30S ribosomal protein S6 [Modestobacter sp. VKM Ac-2977]
MRHYELMIILDPELEDRSIAPSLDRFLSVVTDAGGVVKTEIWGRRRLSYELERNVEGIYAIVDIQAEPAAVAELDRQLNLNKSVLRTKLMVPYKVTSAEKRLAQTKIAILRGRGEAIPDWLQEVADAPDVLEGESSLSAVEKSLLEEV